MSRLHLSAVLTAVFVTGLWSLSWVLITWGLDNVPPLSFAGLRYALAALVLSPLLLRASARARLGALSGGDWAVLIAFGLVQYGVTQGCQFLALSLLPPTTLSLMLSFTPALVAVLGALLLGERLDGAQIVGVAVFVGGACLYFAAKSLPTGAGLGLAIGAIGVLANAGQTLLGRKVNRDSGLPPSLITSISMIAGAAALLSAGVVVEGVPELPARAWLIVGWLAVVHTALAFWLWNRAQRMLGALEASLINNTMMIQIAVLAVFVLGERLNAMQITGLALAGVGVLGVQLARLARP